MATRRPDVGGAGPVLSVLGTNEVRLVGQLADAPTERTLPSDAVMCVFAVVVDRLESALTSRQRVDVLSCVVWKARLRRQIQHWARGDVVEVRGALRKRFFRTATGVTASRVEVEVSAVRRVRKMAA